MDLDELAERLAGYYEEPDETEVDFDNRVLAIRAHLDSPWWVLMTGPDGEFWGFMSWIRTDDLGAWMIREWGFLKLAYLALPLAMEGPHCIMMYAAVDPAAPKRTAMRLWMLMRSANRDAETMQTFFRRPGISHRWFIRRYKPANTPESAVLH